MFFRIIFLFHFLFLSVNDQVSMRKHQIKIPWANIQCRKLFFACFHEGIIFFTKHCIFLKRFCNNCSETIFEMIEILITNVACNTLGSIHRFLKISAYMRENSLPKMNEQDRLFAFRDYFS